MSEGIVQAAGGGPQPDFESMTAQELLGWAFERFGPEKFVLVSSFQAEAVVLIDMAWRICKQARVVTIDTGRLPQETYDLIDEVRNRYGIEVETLFPAAREVEALARRHGMNPFYRSPELRSLCCFIRKVRPLRKALSRVDAWAAGLRRAHSQARSGIKKVSWDEANAVLKICPLADWSDEDVWGYIEERRLPRHALYERGYLSIGCGPCTRPVEPGGDPRSGRWWWEEENKKECGLHARNRPEEGLERELAALLAAGPS